MKKTMMSKTNIKNCLVIYYSSKIFKLSILTNASMNLIERCFPLVANCNNLIELDFFSLIKILSSSELNIDSELQVFNAADSWLSHDITERSKFAKELLSEVRLSLLSIPLLKQISEKNSSFSISNECKNMIKAVLINKEQLNPFSCNITSRYCNQTNFNILVCGGRSYQIQKDSKDVQLFDAKKLHEAKILPQIKQSRSFFEAVCIKGEIFLFGGINYGYNVVRSIEKYSPVTNTWQHVIDMIDDRRSFSACSFMDNIYIIGGHIGDNIDGHDTATCFEFNTKSLNFYGISKMNTAKKTFACSVFEGRVVASGGMNHNNDRLNTVEAYDHVGDTWETLPSMIDERRGHKSTAVKNKLSVVGGIFTSNCEVFDSTANKFAILEQPTSFSWFILYEPFGVITVGNKLYVFQRNSDAKTYDFENNEWSVKTCEATEYLKYFSVLKY